MELFELSRTPCGFTYIYENSLSHSISYEMWLVDVSLPMPENFERRKLLRARRPGPGQGREIRLNGGHHT